jgi:hypothetical protein
MTFTEKEYKHYQLYAFKSKFKSPEEEYEWSETQFKICNKCNKSLNLNNFRFNTSGSSPFNKDGYRYRRGECKECNKKLSKSSTIAKKNTTLLRAPLGTKCEISGVLENLVFDHNQTSNKFRGWISDSCNRSIGCLSTGSNSEIEGITKTLIYLTKNEDPILKNKVLSTLTKALKIE